MARNGAVRGDVDAVIVGSGMGGLTAAALLSRLAGKRVLVLERHWRAGGFTHTFERRGGYRWDVGLHYVGDLSGGLEGDVFRVATGGAVRWNKMADPFERLVFPGAEFAVRSGRENLEADLCRAFPDEAAGIGAFLGDVRRAVDYLGTLGMRSLLPGPVARAVEAIRWRLGRLALSTTREVLERRIRSPLLRAILAARWADHGLPPSRSAFAAHAMIVAHYLGGGFYPEGSAAVLARAAGEVIAAGGGEIRVRAPAERILVRQGRAVGVRLEGGEEIAAPLVISDAGARNTYLRLLPPEVPVPFREELRRIPPSLSAATLYLGLSRSPACLGVAGENFWIHDSLDHDRMADRAREALRGEPPHVYLSFPSMKDPLARAHTAEIIAGVDASAFAPWAGTAWKKRGPDYEALKERIADGFLRTVERRLPGFSALVAYRELSTPLSSEAFTSHPGGEIYGLPATPDRFRLRWLGPRTPLPGLLLAGADAMTLGITGAMMGGALAAAVAEGLSLVPRIRREASRARASSPAAARPGPPDRTAPAAGTDFHRV
jgi:phytoene dehydrogenase-like protein